MRNPYDTIAAIATPAGDGGIGIIRISGDEAISVAARIFATASGKPCESLLTHTVHYGRVIDPKTGESIDDGLLTAFIAPKSYTGEHAVEISCHGGMVAVRRVLAAALAAGARLAEPGEFSKRAFMNGQLDLAQAEAVLDIIRARTDEAMRIAHNQLEGALSNRVRAIREELLGLLAAIEAAIDFPEDVPTPEMYTPLADALTHVRALLATADTGKIYREGIRAVILGRPNVGKSSLMNALLRESRAIVTPIPGTTRDTIEESLNIRGIPIRTIDTAGVRETDDPVEQIGVDRAREAAEQADIVIVVIDATAGVTDEDRALMAGLAGKRTIVVVNKSDLANASGLMDGAVYTSAATGEGIETVEDAIAETVHAGGINTTDPAIVANVRHKQALAEAESALLAAIATAESGLPEDLVSVDLRAAVEALGLIGGETVSEEIIDRIFGEFCIGK